MEKQNVSQRLILSLLKILLSLLNQCIKTPSFHILLKLLVPNLCMKLFKPFSQLRQFCGRQLRNSRFDLFNIHAKSLAYLLTAINNYAKQHNYD